MIGRLAAGLGAGIISLTAVFAQESPSIGYESVAAALDALSLDPGIDIREEAGWTTADVREGDDIVLWTFTSSIHAAHPSAIKRIMYRQGESRVLEMKVLCEAEQAACDELVKEFQDLNDRLRRRMAAAEEPDAQE